MPHGELVVWEDHRLGGILRGSRGGSGGLVSFQSLLEGGGKGWRTPGGGGRRRE